MDIIVCVKRVPDTNEADIQISGNFINTKGLPFDVNEWDKYAVEEAVRLKEKYGGTVTAITIGDSESDDALRRAFATGADAAVRVSDDIFNGSDAVASAKILAGAISDIKHDLVLFGAQASDDGYGATGQAAAAILGLPYASLVIKLEADNGKIRATRELEAGMNEVVELPLPALLTIQSGINEPRYISIMGIRKASSKEIKVLSAGEISVNTAEIGNNSGTKTEKLFLPPVLKQTEFLTGSVDEIAVKLAQILKDKGGTF
ncbi:MAG: electron transfer flavoprotein subunit beta/FixA family protein [Spirochaetia bacterium]|jgi:electron transfer flavoprotein beta subunit|nr:electron transfer flavoprotein subunit beta/FixA family protein [Spirochaetia bacterium]